MTFSENRFPLFRIMLWGNAVQSQGERHPCSRRTVARSIASVLLNLVAIGLGAVAHAQGATTDSMPPLGTAAESARN
jgi:hypothetical protein